MTITISDLVPLMSTIPKPKRKPRTTTSERQHAVAHRNWRKGRLLYYIQGLSQLIQECVRDNNDTMKFNPNLELLQVKLLQLIDAAYENQCKLHPKKT